MEMGSETDDRVEDGVKTPPSKRNPGKTPRKIHKAAREKLKRDQLNELFTNLGRTLGMIHDVDHVNNGKASILRETIKLVGELLTQVESLKKENVTLLSESNYVTAERDELREETSTLDAQIERLQKEINERANRGNFAPKLTEDRATAAPFPLVGCGLDSAPAVGHPLFVVPLGHESLGFPAPPFPEVNAPKVPSSVSKPHPRYPSSSDSWPSHILAQSDKYGDAGLSRLSEEM